MNKMSLIVLLVLLFTSGTLCIIDPEVYQEIKEKAPFEVLEYEKILEIFKDIKFPDREIALKNRMEDKKMAREYLISKSQEEPFLALQTQITLPKEWDWRKIKPECFTPPQAQKNCGSCFAFATVSTLEQRFCILSNSKIRPILSQQDLLSCDSQHNKCDGGTLYYTWQFLEKTGVCSYNCKPYVSFNGSVPKCYSSCDNSFYSYTKYKAKLGSIAIIEGDIQRIKEEIYLYGPVSTSMDTWEDLFAYKSGYYFHTYGKSTDGHAISIVGWGYDEKLKRDYWIIRNSWGTSWGEGGYFKVIAGLYTIGDLVIASKPLL
jgi:C1A family cysteine protease